MLGNRLGVHALSLIFGVLTKSGLNPIRAMSIVFETFPEILSGRRLGVRLYNMTDSMGHTIMEATGDFIA